MNKIVNTIKAGLKGLMYLAMVMSVVIVGCGDNQTTPPTCNDGIQNQDETGIDCGGSTCAACPTQFWNFPTADHTVEQVWAELPNQIFTDIELFQGNQEPPFTWKSHTPGPFLELTGEGLEFSWDPNADKSAFPTWLQYRSEVAEPFTNSVVLGTTSVFAVRFEVNNLPAPLTGPVTIFQRFRDDLDRPDLDVELARIGQFNDAEPNSVLVHAEGDTWKRPNVFLKGPGQTNDLVIAIENTQEGTYKVSLNGQTIAQGTGNFAPATPTTYTAPQFGIYNHGGNQEYFKFTHKKYGRYTYNQTPDLDQINSIKITESPKGLRVLGDIPLIPGLALSQKLPCLRCDDWPSSHRGPVPVSPQPWSDPGCGFKNKV